MLQANERRMMTETRLSV